MYDGKQRSVKGSKDSLKGLTWKLIQELTIFWLQLEFCWKAAFTSEMHCIWAIHTQTGLNATQNWCWYVESEIYGFLTFCKHVALHCATRNGDDTSSSADTPIQDIIMVNKEKQ